MPKEYIIYSDESVSKGAQFSNFYGGALVTSDDIDAVRGIIADAKLAHNLLGEVKWQKITEPYKDKYIALMDVFFDLIEAGKVKIRVMFRQNMHVATGLTDMHKEEEFFILYYQFIKHAFGLRYHGNTSSHTRIRLLLDQLPDNREKSERFRGYLRGLTFSSEFRASKLILDSISDVSSHEHDVLQCLDVVLGSMQFRLNNKHLEKPPGQKRRGKRTKAKEAVYKHINKRIRKIYPNFNIGISTGTPGGIEDRWAQPYRHWLFIPSEFEIARKDRGR